MYEHNFPVHKNTSLHFDIIMIRRMIELGKYFLKFIMKNVFCFSLKRPLTK